MDNDGFGRILSELFVFCKIYLSFDWDLSVIHAVPVEDEVEAVEGKLEVFSTFWR